MFPDLSFVFFSPMHEMSCNMFCCLFAAYFITMQMQSPRLGLECCFVSEERTGKLFFYVTSQQHTEWRRDVKLTLV